MTGEYMLRSQMRTGAILQTARLVLREMNDADAPFILELLNDPAVLRYIGDKGVRTLDDAVEYMRTGPRASYAQFGFGLWLVELEDGTAPIGICGLIKRPMLDDVDVGFALLPRFRSGGYAFEAASAVIGYARDTLCLRRLIAIANADNEPSGKLLEKLGMSFEKMVQPFPAEPALRLYGTTLDPAPSS